MASWFYDIFCMIPASSERRMGDILKAVGVADPYGALAENLVRLGITTEEKLGAAGYDTLCSAGFTKIQIGRIFITDWRKPLQL